jgi:hypothetical protein
MIATAHWRCKTGTRGRSDQAARIRAIARLAWSWLRHIPPRVPWPCVTKRGTYLARFLGNGDGQLPKDVARYILDLHVSERDKVRMHDLAVRNRNQEDALTPAEKEEMHAYGKASTLLSILKAKARRTLGIKLKTRTDA